MSKEGLPLHVSLSCLSLGSDPSALLSSALLAPHSLTLTPLTSSSAGQGSTQGIENWKIRSGTNWIVSEQFRTNFTSSSFFLYCGTFGRSVRHVRHLSCTFWGSKWPWCSVFRNDASSNPNSFDTPLLAGILIYSYRRICQCSLC